MKKKNKTKAKMKEINNNSNKKEKDMNEQKKVAEGKEGLPVICSPCTRMFFYGGGVQNVV